MGNIVGGMPYQTNLYSIPAGTTDVSCATKVGSGYSTNESCKIRTCVGDDCTIPQTFIVTPSSNQVCTNSDNAVYDI